MDESETAAPVAPVTSSGREDGKGREFGSAGLGHGGFFIGGPRSVSWQLANRVR
jgi:hypothetical protein